MESKFMPTVEIKTESYGIPFFATEENIPDVTIFGKPDNIDTDVIVKQEASDVTPFIKEETLDPISLTNGDKTHSDSDRNLTQNVKLTSGVKQRMKSLTRDFACDTCSYRGKDKTALKLHQAIHNSKNAFPCHLCEYNTCRKASLKIHMLKHSDQVPFTCGLCSYKTFNKGSLKRHGITHSKVNPFSCHLCDYKGKRKTSFVSHLSIHNGEKSVACDLCDYRTWNRHQLRSHIRLTHSDEMRYQCPHCPYKGRDKRALGQHIVVHTKTKLPPKTKLPLFSCKSCSFECKTKSKMARHNTFHTRETAFYCPICRYRAITNAMLDRHMISHAGDNSTITIVTCATPLQPTNTMLNPVTAKPVLLIL